MSDTLSLPSPPRAPAVSMSMSARPSTPADAMRVASLLQVAPRRVEFPAFEFHHEYVALLTVRNGSDRALRFRVVPPAPASSFKVLYQSQDLATTANPTMMLPPGLNAKFEVVFVPPAPQSERDARSTENAMIHDVVQLQADDNSRVDVRLVATKAFPDLEVVDSSLCDLGLVVVSHRAAKVIRVHNSGARPGRFDVDIIDGEGNHIQPMPPASPPKRRASIPGTNGVNGGTSNNASGEEPAIAVSPMNGVLLPGESIALKVEVVGKAVGTIRGVLRIRVREHSGVFAVGPEEDDDAAGEGSSSSSSLGLSPSIYVVDKIVDVRASVVKHNVELVQRHGGDKVQNLFFGSLFAGESRVIETVLRNNGPLPLLFHTTIHFGGVGGNRGGDLCGEEDRDAYERRKELQVAPAEGRVEPFGEMPMVFTYHPRSLDNYGLLEMERKLQRDKGTPIDDATGAGTAIPLSAFASIQCAEMQAQNLTFEIAGKMFLPKLELSPNTLDFGDIKSHDRVDMLVCIKNVSGLPVFFSIPKLAQFSTKPSMGRLDVLQSQSIVVSFVPTQLGTFKGKVEVVVNKNVIAYPILVQGTAAALGESLKHDLVGGPTALPSDFEPKYKFMLPEDAKKTKGALTTKFHRMAPYELAALNGTAAVDEFEFQGTNNTHLTYCVKELAKRDDHRRQYNAFVTELRSKREEKTKKKASSLKQTVSMLRTSVPNNNTEGDGPIELIEDVAVNLGMDKQGGLEPRPLKMPRELVTKMEPLWLENQATMGPNGKGKKQIFDENKFVKKKFKPHPATQAEIADCALTLSFDQLELVACGPKTIHFGKLSVNGVGKKSLSVQNALTQNIFVALHLGEQDHMGELAAKTPLKSQVIPPQTLAGFDLFFSSSKEQFFQKTLTLTINGVHTRQVTIVAEVAPIVVSLSASEVPFEFSSTDTNPSMAMELTVTNTSDSAAPFQWKLVPPPPPKPRPDSSKSTGTTATTTALTTSASPDKAPVLKPAYEIFPASGTLGPAESLRCQVIYTPPSTINGSSTASYAVLPGSSPSQHSLVSEYQLDIVGGRKTGFTCRALFVESKFQLKDKKVDYGTIAVGMEREKKIVLANPTSTEESGYAQRLVFYASVEPVSLATALGLSVSPAIGSILPQDSCEISLKMSPHKPMTLDAATNSATLNLQLRGGKCIKMPLLASVVIPEVKISQPSAFEYGDVVIGVSVPRVVSLHNHSNISASLILDLSSSLSSEFSIALPLSLTKHLEDVSSVFMPILSTSITPKSTSEDADSSCAKWQLCIPPNTTVSFHLVFTPQRAGSHDAVLPIQFSGLPHVSPTSTASIARPEAITRRVIAKTIEPRLLFSPSAVIPFNRCVITREGIRKVPYTKTLQLTNNDPNKATIKWQIDTSKFKAAIAAATQAATSKRSTNGAATNPVFHMAPDKGELAPGEDVKVRVSFLPMEAAEYAEDEIPLLIDDKFYINLSISGIGIHPHLSFSENKVVLPTVPLGIPSVAHFFIQSTGYDHLELTYRLPVDLSKAPLSLHFPKGKILSMACPKIPCEVRFLSKKSVAFNARIEFFDADGTVFGLPIAGCTENCLLTNHDFVTAYAEDNTVDLASITEAPSKPLTYYTHPTHKFPVYLLTKKQAESEATKYKAHLLKEKTAAANASAPATPPLIQGHVDVDAAGFNSELAAQPSKHLAPRPPVFTEGETQLLLQYLNSNFFKTLVVKFPEDIADALGKPLYELLEMVCTKKPPPNAIVGSSITSDKAKLNKTTTTSSSNSPPSKKELLAQYTTQYGELLKFLKSYGAMLHDVIPEQLLPQDLYVRACEDPRVDSAILTSAVLLNMKFLQRRHALQSEWASVSATAWIKVLYQVIKCFLLYRVTQKNYVPPQSTSHQHQQKDAAPSQPRSCQGSNVYSESEMVLLQWVCDHVTNKVQNAAIVPEARLLDLRGDLVDGKLLFHVLASHIPTLSLDVSDYRGFRLNAAAPTPQTQAQIQQNAVLLLYALRCFGVDFGIDEKRFLTAMNAREMMLLVLHLYQMLPQFIPKATIEFKGVLGQDMEKTIELKNPSTRAIQYHVFLDSGASGGGGGGTAASDEVWSDFRIESNHVVLEPAKTLAFVVGCKPKFSKKATARLVFQAVRDVAPGQGQSASSGATMVFLLASNIISRKPVRVITIESYAYEKKTQEIVIENQFLANANYKLTMTQMPMQGSSTEWAPSLPASGSTGPSANQSKAKGKAQASPSSGKDKDKDAAGSGTFSHAQVLTRRNSRNTDKTVAPETTSAEHAWCVAAQQPFYLPEYGAAAAASGGPDGGGGGVMIAIRSQASATIKLEFLALVPGNFKCQLLFLDEKVGEFLYEVQGTSHLPVATETLEFQCEMNPSVGAANGGGGGRNGGSHFYRELTLPPKNLQLNKALATFVDRASGLLKTKLKDGLKKCEEQHHTTFVVEFNSPYFMPVFHEITMSHAVSSTTSGGAPKGPKQSVLMNSGDVALTARTEMGFDGGAKSGDKSGGSKNLARLNTPRGGAGAGAMHTASPNSVLIDFQPRSAGQYTCKLLLRSHNTVCGSSDWRVYDLIAKVKEPNVKTLLEFVSPARHSIVQEIPLTNPSDTAWTLKAVFGASGPSGFSGPSSLHVPAKKTINYPLTFAPKWITQEKTSLTLMNPQTQQQFEFELSGVGEEPLAQDHVVLECQARTSLTHEFTVVSFRGDPPGLQTYKVESDLRDVVGASTVAVPKPGDSARYALRFSPIVSGTYFGSITFTNLQTNEYIWYTIEATVAPPAPEATLEMKTAVRGAIGVEISLENPLDHSVEFAIELQGSGLIGPTSFVLGAKESGVYELVYSPLTITAASDGAVLFSNDEIGQFWYALQLIAELAPPTMLEDMLCAVGDVCVQPIWLSNPSDVELRLQYTVSNTRNFSIKGSSEGGGKSSKDTVRLPPFGQASVILEYTPSSLSDFESTQVVFFMPDVVSDWVFSVQGKGTSPSVMKPITVQSKVIEAASTLFTFKNPFIDVLRVDVKLIIDGNDARGAPRPGASSSPPQFDILLRKSRVTLDGFGQLQVPISFLPQCVSEDHAEIVIHGQDEYAELEWRYPIHGVAEAPLHPKSFVLACQARQPLEKIIQCELLAAPPGFSVADETITVEWEVDSDRFGALASSAAIQRCLHATPLPPDPGTPLTLPYALQFEPLRPYRGSVYLVLHKRSGGKWRFEVVLDVSDPPVDDVITIESSLNQTSSVTFQLRNQFREPAPFQAEFSAGSSSAFTVYPSVGVLPSFGSEQGVNFVVSFTPTGYGKMQSGQLVITTEEMQWTFNVKGAYPDISASLGSKSLSSSASRTRLGIDSASPPSSSSAGTSTTGSKPSSKDSRGSKAKRS